VVCYARGIAIESIVGSAAAIAVAPLLRALWDRRQARRPARDPRHPWAFAVGYWIARLAHALAALVARLGRFQQQRAERGRHRSAAARQGLAQ
jgi:hypothetical protein